MSEKGIVIQRATVPEVDVTGDGRTVVLRLLSYGVDYTVSDDGVTSYVERWAPRAFNRNLKAKRGEGLPISWEHASAGYRPMPVGVSTRAWEDDRALTVEGRIVRTNAGDDLVELLRERVVRNVSIEARILRSDPMMGGHIRREAELRAIAFTTAPQYADAELVAMRAEPDPDETPRLDALRALGADLWTLPAFDV